MNKSELINAIAEQGNLSKADAGRSLLAAVKKRGKLADFDDGNRPSILVNKKRGSLRPPFVVTSGCQNGCWFSRQTSVCGVQIIERADTTLFVHQLHNR